MLLVSRVRFVPSRRRWVSFREGKGGRSPWIQSILGGEAERCLCAGAVAVLQRRGGSGGRMGGGGGGLPAGRAVVRLVIRSSQVFAWATAAAACY